MEYNFKKIFARRSVVFLLVLSLVSSTFYLPVFTPRAHAIFGFGDLVIDVKALAERIADGIAMVTAQRMVDDMVRSTVNWAQSGFDGNPAYVTNPEQYFKDLADGIAGDFIAGSDLAYLCSPFQTQIRLSLQRAYTQRAQFQCTLTDVVANIDAFYNDFNQGGWDAWFVMTQNEYNNPYGAYLAAQAELDSRIASSINLKREQLNWSSGFLSYEVCDALTVPAGISDSGFEECVDSTGRQVPKKIVTPGTTIKSQLDEILPSGLNRLISAQHVDQLVSAFASGLLTRYVFGPKGLFNNEPSETDNSRPPIPDSDLCNTVNELNLQGYDCGQLIPETDTPGNFDLSG